MLRGEPVVDAGERRTGAGQQRPAHRVDGVEAAGDEAAAVEPDQPGPGTGRGGQVVPHAHAGDDRVAGRDVRSGSPHQLGELVERGASRRDVERVAVLERRQQVAERGVDVGVG